MFNGNLPPLALRRREVLRIKQKPMADRIGVSQGQLSTVENGRIPNPFDLPRYARRYRLSIEEFTALVHAAVPTANAPITPITAAITPTASFLQRRSA